MVNMPSAPQAQQGNALQSNIVNTQGNTQLHARSAPMSSASPNQDTPSGSNYSPGANFAVRQQEGDGNCLFRAFSDQVYGTPEHHALLRNRCATYISSERDYFEQFVAEPFEDFVQRIQRPGEWGDDVEIEALSEIYDCRVEIYSSYGHALMRTFHEACEAKYQNPIRLQYEGHSHYNSLAPRGNNAFAPIAFERGGPNANANSSANQNPVAPGEIEEDAIACSRRRREAGARRRGEDAVPGDLERTDHEILDESIRQSRLEFKHRSDAEMESALDASKIEWERREQKRADEEVITAVMQQSVLEKEEEQMKMALKESEAMLVQHIPDYGHYGKLSGPSSSSAPDGSAGENSNFQAQYPESVYTVMSMGFSLEACIQAYHLVGDNPEGILAYCCQNLTG